MELYSRLETILRYLDGKGITYLRLENGLAQERLAEKLNCSVRSVSRWENNRGKISNLAQQAIGEVFGDFILGDPWFNR